MDGTAQAHDNQKVLWEVADGLYCFVTRADAEYLTAVVEAADAVVFAVHQQTGWQFYLLPRELWQQRPN